MSTLYVCTVYHYLLHDSSQWAASGTVGLQCKMNHIILAFTLFEKVSLYKTQVLQISCIVLLSGVVLI